jgi:hypothetical protein
MKVIKKLMFNRKNTRIFFIFVIFTVLLSPYLGVTAPLDIPSDSGLSTGAFVDQNYRRISVSGDLIAFNIYERNVAPWPGIDLNGDGDFDDSIIRYFNTSSLTVVKTGLEGISASVSGSKIAFETYEVWVGEDLNGDGYHSADGVIRYLDLKTGEVTNTGVLGYTSRMSGSIIAFGVPEKYPLVDGTDRDLNGDGDATDNLIGYIDITTGEHTYVAEGTGPRISGSTICFWTREEWLNDHAGSDVNGDGDTDDTVLGIYDIISGTTTVVDVRGMDSPSISGSLIVFSTSEYFWESDLNGDGDAVDAIISVYDITTGTLTFTEAEGLMPSISGSLIAYEVWESWYGDLNGDGDTDDSLIYLYDLLTGEKTNTGIFGRDVTIGTKLVAFKTGQTLRYFPLNTPSTMNELSDIVDNLNNNGCIENTGISEVLYALIDQIQATIERENFQAAEKRLVAFNNFVLSQSDVNICKDGVQILYQSAKSIIESLGT